MTPARRAQFRLPGSALFIPIMLFIITTPLASAAVWLMWLWLLPLLGLVYVFWTKTVADDREIVVYDQRGRRSLAWADLDGFEFHGSRWAIAVLSDGHRVRLPMVRPRDLPRLAEVSGGRLYLGPDAVEAADTAAEGATTVVDAAHPRAGS
jgi:hypothetical protein